MDRRLFFLINVARHRLFKFADSACESELGISVTQAGALMFIAKHEGCLQKTLAQALSLNKPAVTGLVRRMQKKELIKCQPCRKDARANRLFLSSKAKELLPQIFLLVEKMNKRLSQNFSAEEIDVVIRFLNSITEDFK